MEHEPIPCKSLAQDTEDPLGIEDILECHDGIVSEADKGTSALKTRPHLVLKPFIQHMVQEDVREAR
jgi:hypothetical protein